MRRIFTFLALVFLSIIIHPTIIFAAGTTQSITSGPWNASSTWDAGVPGNGDLVIINTGHTVIINTSLPNSGISLEVRDGGTLEDDGNGYPILIKTNGSFEAYGTLDVYSIDLKNGVFPKYIFSTGDVTVSHLVDHSGTQGDAFTVDGVLTINPGTLDNDGIINGTGTVTASIYSGTGTLFGTSPTSSITGGTTLSGFTWTGNTDGTWHTASNWSQSEVPSLSIHDVIIPAGLTNYPTITTTVNSCNNLTIESGGQLTIGASAELTIDGTLVNTVNTGLVIQSTSAGDGSLIFTSGTPSGTIQRFVTASEWNMVSPSTTGTTGQTFFNASANDSWLLWFNESTGIHGGGAGTGWEYITDLSTSADVGSGYNYWPGVDETINFEGSIRTTDLPVTINYSGADYGYNLIGNPFSSAVQWNAHSSWNLSTDVQATIWIYNGSQYNAYTTAITHDIPIGQGVFVRAIGPSPTLSFPVSQRVHGSDPFQKNGNAVTGYNNSLEISAHSNEKSDLIHISFGENGTTGFENGWDATKMFGEEIAPQLFMLEEGFELSYNHLPLIDESTGKTVIMNYRVGADGDQVLTAELNNYSGGEIFLEDTQINTLHNLTEDPVYSFMASVNDDESRFLLHFSYTTLDISENNHDSETSIYSFDKHVYIRSLNEINNGISGEVMIYDLYGRMIVHKNLNNSHLTKIPVTLNNSYVVVKVVNEGQVKTEKVLIK